MKKFEQLDKREQNMLTYLAETLAGGIVFEGASEDWAITEIEVFCSKFGIDADANELLNETGNRIYGADWWTEALAE